MLNLGSVMLRACQPFTAGIKDEKVCKRILSRPPSGLDKAKRS